MKIYLLTDLERAAMAGNMNIPTVFISGDDKAIEEAKTLIPNIHFSKQKKVMDWNQQCIYLRKNLKD